MPAFVTFTMNISLLLQVISRDHSFHGLRNFEQSSEICHFFAEFHRFIWTSLQTRSCSMMSPSGAQCRTLQTVTLTVLMFFNFYWLSSERIGSGRVYITIKQHMFNKYSSLVHQSFRFWPSHISFMTVFKRKMSILFVLSSR